MRRTASFVIALLAGLLIWRESRADEGPVGPKAARPGAPDGDAACGAPYIQPCDGTEHHHCANGRIQTSCCPQAAKCNYRHQPFQACGDGFCVEGNDPSLCPPREAQVIQATDEADCKKQYGSWEPACLSGRVTPACIMPVPTNYSGPSRNPPFQKCGDEACTTSAFIEACFPEKKEGATCLFGWTKVCLMGRITERCLTVGSPRTAASDGFVECGDGKCAIGKDANICPAR